MKQLFVYILSAICIVSCGIGSNSDQDEFRTGDLVFLSIPEGEDTLWIHCSILVVNEENLDVIDATAKHGVAEYPLDTLISDYHRSNGTYPSFEVLRLKDTTGVSSFVEYARQFIGESYDTDFSLDNGSHYCSELIADSYVKDGVPLFDTYEIDFRNKSGEYPAFWTRIFGRMNAEIPQGHLGTLPGVMRYSEELCFVGSIPTPEPTLQ